MRNALLAAALAERGHVGGETVLEGEAGFYHAYTGNNEGRLAYSFTGDTRTSLDKITKGLGEEWFFLETLFRIYSTSGYNLAHIDVTAKLCEENDIRPDEVERVETLVNWLETQYPSPAFANRREDGAARPGRHALLRGLRRREARLSAAEQAPRRGRPARGARDDGARENHPLTRDGAFRSQGEHLHERTWSLHQTGHRAGVHLQLR